MSSEWSTRPRIMTAAIVPIVHLSGPTLHLGSWYHWLNGYRGRGESLQACKQVVQGSLSIPVASHQRFSNIFGKELEQTPAHQFHLRKMLQLNPIIHWGITEVIFHLTETCLCNKGRILQGLWSCQSLLYVRERMGIAIINIWLILDNRPIIL